MTFKVTPNQVVFEPMLVTDMDTMPDIDKVGNVRYEPSMLINEQPNSFFCQITMRISVLNPTLFKSCNVAGTFDFSIEGDANVLRNHYHADTIDAISSAYLYAINTTIDAINKRMEAGEQFKDLAIKPPYTLEEVKPWTTALLSAHRG